ncbi:MAG: ABC transporter ATP-binding protein [Desulfobacteraceae bacterium]|nr:ABC transporter ATP-binding protein [Desulfobacteraceae bacterium]
MNMLIEARDVYKSFNGVKAVNGVDLRIRPGQFTALLGPNGAGKTTLVEMIEGIQAPDRGVIRILGRPWKGNEQYLRRRIGLCLQETRFMDKLSVWETLRVFASFFELGKDRVEQILALSGLEQKRHSRVVHLSGGQRQRLALGISLLNNPQVLLLDEPTTGLDPNARREIWSILLDLKKNTRTCLVLTTHYMEEAEKLCEHIQIMDQGRVLREGSLQDLLEDTQAEKIIEFTIDNPDHAGPELLENAPFAVQWDPVAGRGTVAISDIEHQLPVFLEFLKSRGLHLKNMECRRKTLDDLFTEMTGRRLHD